VRVLLVIIVHAAVQALLVLDDPTPGASSGFLLAASVSAIVLVAAVWLVAVLVVPSHRNGTRPGRVVLAPETPGGVPVVLEPEPGSVRHWRPVVLLRVIVLGVLAAASSLLSPALVPVVLVLGAPLLVARPSVYLRPIALLLTVFGLVLAAVSWVGALALGFFVTGPVAAFATWLWFGGAAALLLRTWAMSSRPRVGQ
jgi:hypothetical protein